MCEKNMRLYCRHEFNEENRQASRLVVKRYSKRIGIASILGRADDCNTRLAKRCFSTLIIAGRSVGRPHASSLHERCFSKLIKRPLLLFLALIWSCPSTVYQYIGYTFAGFYIQITEHSPAIFVPITNTYFREV